MSETRKPDIIWRMYLPQSSGKKLCKICAKFELYLARQFALNWRPGSCLFSPYPPLNTDDRQQYWESRYRVRINGQWYSDTAKYQLLTLSEIAVLFGLSDD